MDAQYHLNNVYFDDPPAIGNINLIQIGRRHCKTDTVVPTHLHLDWFELTIVTDGEGIVSTGGIPTPVSRGDIYLSYPCDAHKLRSHPARPLKYDFFAFRPREEGLRSMLDRAAEERPGADERLLRDDRVAYLVGSAIAEFCAEQPPDMSLLAAIFHQTVTYLMRDLKTLNRQKRPSHATPAEALCFRLMNHIDTHLNSIGNLRELSDLTGYHYSYLSTLFRQTTGMTLFEYYHNKKLEAARLLLREKRLRISEIADTLGYSSVYAFSKAYRNRFGVSPRGDACGRGRSLF